MGIINVTPDSFSDGGRYFDKSKAVEHGLKLAVEGADIIDIGGESTRPGAKPVTPQEQIERTREVIAELRKRLDIPISIDTTSSEVASAALSVGASIINDISALRFDDRMVNLAKEYDSDLILMHMIGIPENMQENPDYDDIISEISEFFKERIQFAEEHGIDPAKIIIDPGIGFGKTIEGNLELLRQIVKFRELGKPVLIGASRKSFIGKIIGREANDRLAGSIAVACFAAYNNVDILRVHDVKETLDAVKVILKLNEN
ncbi:MAG: dihydropteroate synthase [candidate division Zixibacteria bacterium]|nr:dihydropteroate synthase [candidate division Zixibacteria bacterium]